MSEIKELTGGIPRHVEYLQGFLARAGKWEERQKLLSMSAVDRAKLNARLGKKFEGKTFEQVDDIIRRRAY